jgi:hypothetical protein
VSLKIQSPSGRFEPSILTVSEPYAVSVTGDEDVPLAVDWRVAVG